MQSSLMRLQRRPSRIYSDIVTAKLLPKKSNQNLQYFEQYVKSTTTINYGNKTTIIGGISKRDFTTRKSESLDRLSALISRLEIGVSESDDGKLLDKITRREIVRNGTSLRNAPPQVAPATLDDASSPRVASTVSKFVSLNGAPISPDNLPPQVAPAASGNLSPKAAPVASDDSLLRTAPPPSGNALFHLETSASVNDASNRIVPVTSDDFSSQATPVASENKSLQGAPAVFEDASTQVAPAVNNDLSLQVAPAASENLLFHVAPATSEDLSFHVAPTGSEDLSFHVAPTGSEDLSFHVAPAVSGNVPSHVTPAVSNSKPQILVNSTDQNCITIQIKGLSIDHLISGIYKKVPDGSVNEPSIHIELPKNKINTTSISTSMTSFDHSIPNIGGSQEILIERQEIKKETIDNNKMQQQEEMPQLQDVSHRDETRSAHDTMKNSIQANEILSKVNEYPPGSMPAGLFSSAAEILDHLIKNGVPENITISFDLLHRLSIEKKKQKIKFASIISGDFDFPDTELLNLLVKSWAQCWEKGDRVNPTPADALRMLQALNPNTTTFSSIMSASMHFSSDNFITCELASSVLDKMKELSAAGNKEVRPDSIIYSRLINIYAILGFSDQAERALYEMYVQYEKGNKSVKPTQQIIDSVFKAFLKSKRGYAPKKAEELLKHISIFKPSDLSYALVLQCWANSKKKDSAERAEAILCEMKRLFGDNESDVQLTNWYNVVINAYADAGNIDRAHNILTEMIHAYRRGYKSICPDVHTFNSVLIALSKSDTTNAAEKAVRVLGLFRELSCDTHLDLSPNKETYRTMLHCFAKSSSEKSGKLAEAILREMERLAVNDRLFKPSTSDYNKVINAYANVGNINAAEKVFQGMILACKIENVGVKPDGITCATYLKACLYSNNPNSLQRAQSFFNAMIKMYKTGFIKRKSGEEDQMIVAKELMSRLRRKHVSSEKLALSINIQDNNNKDSLDSRKLFTLRRKEAYEQARIGRS